MSKLKGTAILLSAVMAVGIFTGCQSSVTQAEPSADVKYLLSEKTEYDYSGLFNKKDVTKYSYNEVGLLISEERSDGSKILYEYNEDGKEIKETAYNSDGEEKYCYHTEYDENGNMTLQEDSSGVSKWTYNKNNQLTKEKLSNSTYTEYTYNDKGLLSCEKTYDNDTVYSCYYEYGETDTSEVEIDINSCRKVVSEDTVSTYRISDSGQEYLECVVKTDNNENEVEITAYYETGNVASVTKNSFSLENNKTRTTVISYAEDGTVDYSDDLFVTDYDIVRVDYNEKYLTEEVFDKFGKIAGVKQTTDTGEVLADVLINEKADYVEYTQMIKIEGEQMKSNSYRIYYNENMAVFIKYNSDEKPDYELTMRG